MREAAKNRAQLESETNRQIRLENKRIRAH